MLGKHEETQLKSLQISYFLRSYWRKHRWWQLHSLANLSSPHLEINLGDALIFSYLWAWDSQRTKFSRNWHEIRANQSSFHGFPHFFQKKCGFPTSADSWTMVKSSSVNEFASTWGVNVLVPSPPSPPSQQSSPSLLTRIILILIFIFIFILVLILVLLLLLIIIILDILILPCLSLILLIINPALLAATTPRRRFTKHLRRSCVSVQGPANTAPVIWVNDMNKKLKEKNDNGELWWTFVLDDKMVNRW